MKKTTSLLFSTCATGALALMAMPQLASANPITGSISFNGNVTPYQNTAGTGAVAANYSQARSLVFGQTSVSDGATGSFSIVTANSQVTLYSPLQVNPAGLPVPANTPLWTTAIGNFSFTLSTLTEDVLVSPFNTMTLRGSGFITDGNPADTTAGTWVATFTSAQANSGLTFSWNSSSAAEFASVSENSAGFMLFGVGLISLGAFGFVRKEAVAA